jgi:hypothetical protein
MVDLFLEIRLKVLDLPSIEVIKEEENGIQRN